MDILRNIEKKLLIILSDKDKIDISKINNLKGDIRVYVEDIDKKREIITGKKNKYIELYHSKRLNNEEKYEKYLIEKENLMSNLIKHKNKSALHDYLNQKLEYNANIPDIYTYENISLHEERPTRDPTKINANPVKLPSKPKQKEVKEEKPDKECPEGKEINPVTKRCVKICDKDKIRNQLTGKCEKIKTKKTDKVDKVDKVDKECPEGKEINPITKRCIKICDKDKTRNPKTGKCEKIKK
jgi:hypothetical protein